MSEEPAPYSVTSAEATEDELEDAALDVREDLQYIQEQLDLCLDVLNGDVQDLDGLQERYGSLARKMRRAAERLDPKTDLSA